MRFPTKRNMGRTYEDLPDDCWEPILSRLRHHHLESLSLVSKAFLSLTDRLRVSLKVVNSSKEVISKQLQRFPNLKRIDLSSSRGTLHVALREIGQSQVNLEEINVSRKENPPVSLLNELGLRMTGLKVFKCSYSYLTDDDLISMADNFASLEELDISQQYFHAITDKGIIALSKKLKWLQKIDLSSNGQISDHSLIALSTNCKLLKKVVLRHCPGVSQAGIDFLMRNSQRYSSLVLESNHKTPLVFTTSFNYVKQLNSIQFSNMKISNNILDEIAKAKLPLKKFHLSFCTDFTMDGLTSLLKAYQSLETLALDGTNFLTDENLKSLSQYLSKLTSINLNFCFKLTISSFVVIALACPIIKHIEIVLSSSSDMQKVLECSLATPTNTLIRSVCITCTSTTLEKVLPICPNLEALNVTTLVQSHELDIAYIVRYCSGLRHLAVNHSEKIIFRRKSDREFTCKLESLSARKSRIDDKLLKKVGARCPNLLNLDLQGCKSVTETRVRDLAENCKRIRYMNLNCSIKVDKPLVAWLVALRPSLRNIVIPYSLDKDQTNSFVIQGCVVHPGIWEEWCLNSFDT
ncbi:hypothetical protein RND81_09G130000 [Saponaria officinalis]|uniref:F-box domain-containing protein n=1 Tax=Saponaria officinalis TaxID=3572 RepID=A0AAW1IK38_SAPOF